jgi:methionine synthase I (cobalamin-dependent)
MRRRTLSQAQGTTCITAVVGGCCGTDHRHVAAPAGAWLDAA